MTLIALGINHNTAPVEIRERVAFAADQVSEALQDLCERAAVDEAVILSTCNRTELYAWPRADATQSTAEMLRWLATYHHLPEDALSDNSYQHTGEHALRHMMKVASGLDSMVLGEPQILGQMKSAHAVAQEAGTVNGELGRLFQRVFAVAKRVRTDTAIGENPVSVAYAAVDLAGHIFSDLHNNSALLVGAGETIELVARHLREAGVSRLVIANRTLGRARELAAQFGAEAVLLADIPQQLEHADIVITSTASQLPILGKGAVEQALKQRRHRPMLMVDIAVPRDIEPQVGELADVYLYSVDDLREIVDENIRSRQEEASKADLIIEEGLARFRQESRARGAVDAVRQYRRQSESTRDAELERALKALTRGEDPVRVVKDLARGITNKLIHAPTAGLKEASAGGDRKQLALARALLGLNESDREDENNNLNDDVPAENAPDSSATAVDTPVEKTG